VVDSLELKKLNDNDLICHLGDTVRNERGFTVQVLLDLNEMYRRRLYLDLGYSSLFDYCVRKLKYSSSAAGRRIQAARCIRRFPETLRMLRDNELSLSSISLIEPILCDENKRDILDRVRGASSRVVERIASEFRPPVRFADRVQPVHVAETTPGAGSVIKEKQLVQFLADAEDVQLFNDVRALLSSSGPAMSFADVMRVVFTEFRDRHSPAARHARRQNRIGVASLYSRQRECDDPHTRHIPDEVRDAVFVRDHGQCTFTATDGTHCESTCGVQVDHIRPFAAGGTHAPSNLRLLCAAHNRRAAEKTFGSTQYRRE
jgi:hypothetical protein